MLIIPTASSTPEKYAVDENALRAEYENVKNRFKVVEGPPRMLRS